MLFPSHSSSHADGAARRIFSKLIQRLRTTVETRIGLATPATIAVNRVLTYTPGTNKGVKLYVYAAGNLDYAGVSETAATAISGPVIVRYSNKALVAFDAASDAAPPVGGDLAYVSATTDGLASSIRPGNNFTIGEILDGSMYSPTNRYAIVQLRHCNQYAGQQ